MVQSVNTGIRKSLELAEQLRGLADSGVTCLDDDGCALLYGVVRDCAYKIRKLAEDERRAHMLRGIWDE